MKQFYFRKFIFNGKPYSFKVNAGNIKEALKKAVNWGLKKHHMPKEYFAEQLKFAQDNLEKGFIVVEVLGGETQTEFNFDKTFEKLYSGLINEEIRGEWWITENGDVWFADGDVGDMNHEMIVASMCSQDILNYLGIEIEQIAFLSELSEDESNEIKSVIIEEKWGDVNSLSEDQYEEYQEWLERVDIEEAIREFLKENTDMEDVDLTVDVAFNNMDAREYGMQKLGWKRVHGNWIQTQFLTERDLKIIASGVDEILSEVGYYDTDDSDIKETFNIEVYATHRTFTDIPWSVLNKGNISSIIPYRDA